MGKRTLEKNEECAEEGRPKKRKTSPDTKAEETPKRKRKYKKRQVLIFCQYLGTGYFGSMWNTDKRAIENVVHDAIVLAGGVEIETNRNNPKKLNWSRSSRTDKGVHAALNVFSARLSIFDDLDKMPDAINKHLPPSIRVIEIFQGTKKFDARRACSSRKYEYLLPSFLLTTQSKIEDEGNFRLSEQDYESVRATWQLFLGTHKFHNFTKGKQHNTSDVKRHMKELTLSRLVMDGKEYVRFFLHGQSFLLNQIRKMIGYNIASQRGKLPEDAASIVFAEGNYKVPTAPSQGLFLMSSLFERFNVKMININQEQRQIHIEKFEPQIQDFISNWIHPEIKKQHEVFQEFKVFIDEEYEWQEKEYQPKKKKPAKPKQDKGENSESEK